MPTLIDLSTGVDLLPTLSPAPGVDTTGIVPFSLPASLSNLFGLQPPINLTPVPRATPNGPLTNNTPNLVYQTAAPAKTTSSTSMLALLALAAVAVFVLES